MGSTIESISRLGAALRRATPFLPPSPNAFIARCRGVVHVGANVGQERERYARFGLSVLWIEPDPATFETLAANVRGFPRQRAVRALVADRDGQELDFHVSSNSGESSSILRPKGHLEVWPEVAFERTITLRSQTLASVLAAPGVDAGAYDALVMDTQGAEMHVLRGAGPALDGFRFVKAEGADFEMYEGAARIEEIAAFLGARGFVETARRRFATHPGGGGCYDALFERRV